MNWLITGDFTGTVGHRSAVGTCNFDANHDPDVVIREPRITFQLLDDDGELCYEGIANQAEFERAHGDEAFEPLDWAAGDAGATTMQYRNTEDEEWTTL